MTIVKFFFHRSNFSINSRALDTLAHHLHISIIVIAIAISHTKKLVPKKKMSSFLTSNVLLPTKYLKRMMTWKKKHENKRLFVVLFPFFCCHCHRFASLFPFFPIRYQKDGWKQKHTRERERETTTKSDKNYCRGYYKTNGNLLLDKIRKWNYTKSTRDDFIDNFCFFLLTASTRFEGKTHELFSHSHTITNNTHYRVLHEYDMHISKMLC